MKQLEDKSNNNIINTVKHKLSSDSAVSVSLSEISEFQSTFKLTIFTVFRISQAKPFLLNRSALLY